MRTFLVLLACAAVARADLSVGFAEADVTPKLDPAKPVYMAGFGHNRQAAKVHDPIMARAVVLADGKQKVALVAVDVVGPVQSGGGIASASSSTGSRTCCVSSTHNHEGPDTLGLWGKSPFVSGLDKAYLKTVEAGSCGSSARRDKARKPATAKIGTGPPRSCCDDNREPYVKHDELVAIRFDGADGKPLGVLVQWNCHPETMASKNTELTADYVGYTVSELKKSQGCPVAYFTGTVGGLMTTLHLPVKDAKGEELKDGTLEKTEEYGKRLARSSRRSAAQGREAGHADAVRGPPLEVLRPGGQRPVQARLAVRRARARRSTCGRATRTPTAPEGDEGPDEAGGDQDGGRLPETRRTGGGGDPRRDLPGAGARQGAGPGRPRGGLPGRPGRAGHLRAAEGEVPDADRAGQRRDRVHHPEAAVGREGAVLLRAEEGAVRRGEQRRPGGRADPVQGVRGAW